MDSETGALSRRTFLRATGAAGGSLAVGSFAGRAAADECGDTYESSTDTGYLDGAGASDEYSFTTALAEPCEVVYMLTSSDPVDFDLYLTLDGRTPAPDDYDRRSAGTGTDEEILLDDDEVYDGADYGVLVYAYDGSGDYTLEAEEYGLGGASNQPPQAKFSISDSTVDTGDVVEFDADQSYDDDGQVEDFHWEFGDGTDDYGEVVDHEYDDAGTYEVTLTVTDDDGATDSQTDTVEVEDGSGGGGGSNDPPEADFYIDNSDGSVTVGSEVDFDASDSYDPDGSITSFSWDFGDGDQAGGEYASHTYDETGTYQATLTVTDDDGATDSAYLDIEVTNAEPEAVIEVSDESPLPGDTVEFDGRESSDPGGAIVAYDWQFGDGTRTRGRTTEHTYDEPGNYTVRLTVRDDDGATAATEREIGVVNGNLEADFTLSSESVGIGETVTVDGSPSSDPDDDIVSYDWDFGDGTTATGQTASHSYDTGGSKTITLTVTGEHGYSTDTTKTVQVTNEAPTARAEASSTTPEVGSPVTFDGSGSTDPDGASDIDSYVWTFPGGLFGPGKKRGKTVTHEFDSTGSVDVTLEVTDRSGAVDTTTVTVEVQESDDGGGSFW